MPSRTIKLNAEPKLGELPLVDWRPVLQGILDEQDRVAGRGDVDLPSLADRAARLEHMLARLNVVLVATAVAVGAAHGATIEYNEDGTIRAVTARLTLPDAPTTPQDENPGPTP
jgi:hypothetical protein